MKKVQYIYKEGDIITNVHSGKLQILEQIKIKDNRGYLHKGYKYKCLICGNKDVILQSSLEKNRGCNVCCNPSKKILIGYNDIWTTNLELAKLLVNPEDGYKYTQGSGKRVDFKCPNCGNIINKKISKVKRDGLFCPKCNDKLPYTEKFIFNVFQQLLSDNFIYQLSKITFKWCKNHRYDFYFKVNNERYILEVNGLQHYQDSFESCGGKTLRQEQENDKLKRKLALQNGIKEENYIVIDCRYSELEWIKENILNSRLNELFDLSKINWLECHKYTCSSLVKKACELWNSGIHNVTDIGKIMKLSNSTIVKYLKHCSKLKWCNYNSLQEHINSINKMHETNKIKVICLDSKKIFESIKNASNTYKVDGSTLSKCCRRKQKSCGKDPITGKKLHWMYYEDYLKMNKEGAIIA